MTFICLMMNVSILYNSTFTDFTAKDLIDIEISNDDEEVKDSNPMNESGPNVDYIK